MSRRMIVAVAVTAVAGLAASLGWIAWQDHVARAADVEARCGGTVLPPVADGGDIALVAGTGETLSEAQIFDRPALVYFGYAHCPDVCPIDNARNSEAADLLEAQGIEVRPIFVTVDPGRDTPEVMADYASVMHPRMLGLTGTPEQIATAARRWRVYYNVHAPEGDQTAGTAAGLPLSSDAEMPGMDHAGHEMSQASAEVPADYPVEHSTLTYLVAPGLTETPVFARDATAEEVAARAACVLNPA